MPLLGIGILSLMGLVSITVLAFYGLMRFSTEFSLSLLMDSYIQGILIFSIKQACLSTVLSVVLGYILARVLYYSPYLYGRSAFLSACLLAFVMPTLVLITGLVSLLGRNGWLAPLLGKEWSLYGLQGILIAHIYLNTPFVIRALFLQLQTIPDSSWRLALQLKLNPWQRWLFIEWASVRGRLLAVTGFVFILCFNSFAVVLALGGGPQSSTFEVAIYQALKYDFNINEALTLAWLQFIIAGVLFAALARLSSGVWLSPDTGFYRYIPEPSNTKQVLYRVLYLFACIVLLLPILTLFTEVLDLDHARWQSMQLLKPTLITLGLSFAVAIAAVILGYLVLIPLRNAVLKKQKLQWLWEWLALHTLVAPAMVLSVGIYILVLRTLELERWGLIIVWVLNTALLLPFVIQQLKPRILQFDAQYERMVLTLKLTLLERLKVEWFWLRGTLGAALVLVLLLAMGEVAIFAVFGAEQGSSLPWLIYSYASTYRLPEAALASLILLGWCGAIVWGWEYWQSRKTPEVSDNVRN